MAEEIEILFPFKGAAGPVIMNMPVHRGVFWATANATSFHAAEGTLVFAALNETDSGAVISECTQQLFIRPGRDRIIAALFEMWRQGSFAASR